MTLRTAGKRASELTATALITLIILFVSMIPVSAAERHEPHGQGQGMGWGDNGFGQLGDNTATDRHTPVQIKGPGGPGHLEDVLSLAAGAMHNLALKSDGTVWAWGYNPDGRLGDNTTTDRTAPVQVAGPGGVGHLTGMVAIAAGYVHSLALRSDGTVWAWGDNAAGELGDNTTTDRHAPVQVKGKDGVDYLNGVVAIGAGGSQFSLALRSDGTVWAWGSNWAGQLGDNTTTMRYTPVQVVGTGGVDFLTNVMAIAAGDRHNLALLSDGTVRAWGYNGLGMLGDDSIIDRHTPVVVHDTTGSSYLWGAVGIAGGGSHSMALMRDGTVQAWGYNGDGELGDNTTSESHIPVLVKGPGGVDYLGGATAISAGGSHSMALLSDGTLRAWGRNNNGQLGDSTISDRHAPVQVLGPGGSGTLGEVAGIAAGASYSLAVVDDDGPGATWGDNKYGQLGDNTTTLRNAPVHVLGPAGSGYLAGATSLAGGYWHSVASTSGGTVWAWGVNNYGQLGDNTTDQRNTPVQVLGLGGSGTLTGVKSVASGYYHNLALLSDGTVAAWGFNDYGQLGDTSITECHYPKRVSDFLNEELLYGITAIAAGDRHSLALKSNGTVVAWGWNNCGQLGDNTTTNKAYPVPVLDSTGPGKLSGVVAIAANGMHSLALKSDGSVWAWGYNNDGQLGDTTRTNRLRPVQVVGPGGSGYFDGVVSIAAGYYHSLAVRNDGKAWAWGANNLGQLGDDMAEDSSTVPVQVLGPGGSGFLTGVASLAGGRQHSLAVMNDGTATAWGRNDSGELGDNTYYTRSTPVQVLGLGGVGNLTSVTAITAGYSHSLALNAPNPTPAITTLDPDHKTAGNAGFTLTVKGTNFFKGSKVNWNGSERSTTYVNAGQLTAAITSGDIESSGTATVSVVNPEPCEGPSDDVTFVIYPIPSITSLSPTSGYTGNYINVGGHGFGTQAGNTNYYVKFGNVKATAYSYWADNKIRVKVPSGAYKACNVVVYTPYGKSNPNTFKVKPNINSISPTSGKRTSRLTIYGNAFCPTRYASCYVKFGATKASTYYSWSNNKIVVRVPSASYGRHYVRVTTTGGTSTGKTFTVKR